jgi:hypothetical protein
MPHWVYVLGRKFAATVLDPNFKLLNDWPYWNQHAIEGRCYYADWHDGLQLWLLRTRVTMTVIAGSMKKTRSHG